MKIRMLVDISRDDFNARLGQEIDVDDELAAEMCADGRAEQLEGFTPRKTQTPPMIKKPKVAKSEVNDG